ncbi:MAG TPA: oxidoreductase [Marmoricola sp.]|jgi:hemoglobin|nr:oxidoreductase [Marmoricola sp.]
MAHDDTIFDAAGGLDGLTSLAHAWHLRVLADEVVVHSFSHGYHADHTHRLATYWAEALGGPAHYSRAIADESAVIRMHSGNGAHDEMDERAIACFEAALADVGFDADPRLFLALADYFRWATTGPMAAYPDSADDVPDGLAIARWDWDGPL